MFCSLCIQSFVKKLLQALLKEQYAVGINLESGAEYLQEVVQLFTALSSGFDPIVDRDGAQLDVRSVRGAIFYQRWLSNRTQNSFQYLESLFYAQGSPTMDLLKALTNESPIANLCPRDMSLGIVGHSRPTIGSDGTEHQEKLRFDHGSTDGALCNAPGRKRNEEITLIIETPYEGPKDPELTKCQKPLDYVQQLQEKNSHLEVVSNAPITTDPTQGSKINVQKSANNTKEEASRGNIPPFVEAQPKPFQPVSSPSMFSQSQDDPPPASYICSELDSEPDLHLISIGSSKSYKFENGRRYHSVSPERFCT